MPIMIRKRLYSILLQLNVTLLDDERFFISLNPLFQSLESKMYVGKWKGQDKYHTFFYNCYHL